MRDLEGYLYVKYIFPPSTQYRAGEPREETRIYSDLRGTIAHIPVPQYDNMRSSRQSIKGVYLKQEEAEKESNIVTVKYFWISSQTEKEDQEVSSIVRPHVSNGGKDSSSGESVVYNTTDDVVFKSNLVLDDTYGTGCYYLLYASGSLVGTWPLPVYPQEFSDNNNVEFTSTTILGRSVAYQTYNHSSRSVNFTLSLHEEIVHRFAVSEKTNSAGDHYEPGYEGDGFNYDYLHELVSAIQSACYPEYTEGIVNPPEVEFIIGNQFAIRGILTGCSSVWKPPFINGRYVCCDLSLGITETTGPYSMSDIQSIRGRRVNHNVT